MDLEPLFAPRSIALIGASADPQSISARPLRMLRQHGYAGRLYPVNPKYQHQQLDGLRVFGSISAVPEPVDLALVAVPAPSVVEVLEGCAVAGVRFALVLSSGFAESGPAGERLQAAVAEVCARTGLRVSGPNAEGLYYPVARVCATFSPALDPEHGFAMPPLPPVVPTASDEAVAPPAGAGPASGGPVAVVSQSGGLGFAILNQGREMGLAFGAVVSTGNEVDLAWLDYVDWLLDDPGIRVVLGFVEGLRRAERLPAVARKAARLGKPIVVAKIGRSEAGRRAAASHTGSLVGSDTAYAAAFRQLGILRVDDVDEMLDLAAYVCVGRLPAGRRLAVLTTSGGAGAWLADACATRGFDLPAPDPADQAAIASDIPAYGSTRNPVDITAQGVLGGGFEHALGRLLRSDRFDVVAGVGSMVREERFFASLPALREAVHGAPNGVVFYSYTRPSRAIMDALAALGIACYTSPLRAARALDAAATYAAARADIGQLGLFDGRVLPAWPSPGGSLGEAAARAYLAPLGIPSPADRLARSADEAVACWDALGGGPVALKAHSAALVHKSDVGGVRLALHTAEQVRTAYAEIVAAVRAAGVDLDGVLVQRMAPAGPEVLLAARRDPSLGPFVVCGLGGEHVEALADLALRLAPVSAAEAERMLDELRGSALFRRPRGGTAWDVAALVAAVVRVSELAAGLPPDVATVEINPLRVLPAGQGLLMLDAAVEVC